MMNRISLLTLVLIAALAATTAWATDLPAQEARIWAPTGDLIGLENHATVTGTSRDPHGSQIKYAEDWQQEDDQMFGGLFAFRQVYENGRTLLLRGLGESGKGTFAGRFTMRGRRPGKCGVDIDIRNFHNFYDATSEMRAVSYGLPPAPPAMDPAASMDWRHSKLDFRYNLAKGLGVELGFRRMCRDGDKASLLSGATGLVVPTRKAFDTEMNEFGGALTFNTPKLALKAGGLYRASEGDRAVGEHTYSDDQTLFRANLEARYHLGSKTSLLGMASSSKLEAQNSETYGGSVYAPDGEATGTTGRLGAITRLGQGTVGRVSIGIRSLDTDNQTDLAGAIDAVTSRERSGMDFHAGLTNTALRKTRIRLDYKLRANEMDETTEAGGETQTIDQKKTDHRLNLKLQRRFNSKTSLNLRAGYRMQSVEQDNDWTGPDALFYVMGDRDVSDLKLRADLKMRPSPKVRLTVGGMVQSRNFQREDEDDAANDVETKTSRTHGFLGLNVFASERVTFLGHVSYGKEKHELDEGPVSETGMAPLTYEGSTLRFAPGVMVKLTEKLSVEGHYEGVRFEDPGDQADDVHTLNSDLDRMLLRCGYRLKENLKVSATYRRHEFDENRWDDYIMDLYSLSLSGKF